MMISKDDQLRKVKRVNTKRMSAIELKLYKDFIFGKSDGKCQCGCGRELNQYHHSERGSNKDDRSLTGINDVCHNILHFSTDTHMRESLTIRFKSIGIENWREYGRD